MISAGKFLHQNVRGSLPREFANEELPLRSELFSADQMEQHGRTLAALHKVTNERTADNRLLDRLRENEAVLNDACVLLTEAANANRRMTPAGEWLLDNFYLIEEQIRTARMHLPKGYSRELPRLINGDSHGLPRVYDIALATISHGDGRVDPENLIRFVASYQTVTELRIGELWAIPIMLRLALIENLRRVAVRMAAHMIERDLADAWADKMIDVAMNDPKSLILVIADMARSNPPMVSSFVAELARRLQGQGSALALGLTWIEQRLSEAGLTIEHLVQSDTQSQAADQVSISNSIGSLRFLGSMDWRRFVESQSVVEQILRQDPSTAYAGMDFTTRDQYRHVIEKTAKKCSLSEGELARVVLQSAEQGAATAGSAARQAHVGFYLIDRGLNEIERTAAVRHSFKDSLKRLGCRFPLFFYLGTIALSTAVLTGVSCVAASRQFSGWLLVLAGVVLSICASQLAVALVNWFATILVSNKPLPKMDFSEGVPSTGRTLVVVPTMIANAAGIDKLIEAMEVRFLANRDDNLQFALLTDFLDTESETTPQDDMLLRMVRRKIEELNEKYKPGHQDTFFLFHRPRRFNSQDRIWMGYERKRGKLADLNALLRGGKKNAFSMIVGDIESLQSVKYIITLDTDTQLPRDSAKLCIGAMMHPLNQVVCDAQEKRIVDGYGILQPRVSVSLPGTNRSRYAGMHGNEPGIDPYTRSVSDVYQDVFHEGSFIGKGIYDLDAFEFVLKNTLPENSILSHDLLEGCYARSGLLSDVQLYEEYPSGYLADVSRRRRWIRGDWQLLGWLWPAVPGVGAQRVRNPLSLLSRWKIFDNIRRSLVPPCLVLMMIVGWAFLPAPYFWTLAAIAVVFLPALMSSLLGLFRKPDDVLLDQHLAASWKSTYKAFEQCLFDFIVLPHEAAYTIDSIARTIVRIIITRRNLLAWNPSGERVDREDLKIISRKMVAAPLLATLAYTSLYLFRFEALIVAMPILVLWFLSPLVAWWMSKPLAARTARLSEEQILFLRKMGRQTWAFFQTFITAGEHWLPPDNVQEVPIEVIAHRTSPTNMGISLLANLSAHDFGYIQTTELIERTEGALQTMCGLERYRGHLYNWYDTLSLRPLPPHYVSTVDSGNLAGHLVTLNSGLLELIDERIVPERVFDGFEDTVASLRDVLGDVNPPALKCFEDDLKDVKKALPNTLSSMHSSLEKLSVNAARLVSDMNGTAGGVALFWAQALEQQASAALNELLLLAPWTSLPGLAELETTIVGIHNIPTLRDLANIYARSGPSAEGGRIATSSRDEHKCLAEVLSLLSEASRRAKERIATIEMMVLQATELADMEYDFLYDKSKRLFSIGYHVDERRLDSSFYDLLASEARLGHFVSIAQDKIPQESWFSLGRLLTTAGGEPVLFSWSGSMFEYLMPLLVMPNYSQTLLDQTYRASVTRQMEYARQCNVPWGISESGYFAVDVQLNFQYRAFGVPGLGLKRGLAQDLVVAPYASAMALMVAPEAACLNLQRLHKSGFSGQYGFYEAIDYTTSRIPRGQDHAIVKSFMVHHQGMTLLSLAYLLLDQPMQRRFETDPAIQATLLLLQERVPRASAFHSQAGESFELRSTNGGDESPIRFFNTANTPEPEVQLLSNGRYHVMITNAGGGYSRWKDTALTRWREDTTRDNWGTFLYIRDVSTGEFWSSSYQPTLKEPDFYEAIFSESRVEFRRRDFEFDTHAEIVVSSEDDIELRRVRITNRSRTRRTIEITSYAEVVLAPPMHDTLHPAFSNLFVQTEIYEPGQAIICNRRARSEDEHLPWMFHLMAVHGATTGDISYETDRMQFIGRGNTQVNPLAMTGKGNLSGSQGSVLDPIVAIRQQITLEPEKSATVNIVSGIAQNREGCIDLIGKYQDRRLADRVFDLTWTHSQVVLRQLNATESDGQLFAGLAKSVIFANPSLRADPAVLVKNRRGQPDLWGYAISGDLPIVLLQITDPANIDLVRQLVQAHAYWRLKGLAVDLVIWNEDRAGYRQLIQEQIMALVAGGMEANLMDKPGGIFVRPSEQISTEDRILLQTVARAIIKDSLGTLAEQMARRKLRDVRVPKLVPTRAHRQESPTTIERNDLIYANGLGGFTPDGREYVIITQPGQVTPAPWVNVLANQFFGTVISESGQSYTWLENAHEYRLTPWHNDPVTDAAGEAYYLRDEESGYFWSPCPLPARGINPYVTRHGFGYSVFEHTESGITTELTVYAALDAPVKVTTLKVRNQSGRSRRLSATSYSELVLGDLRSKTIMHVVTEIDEKTGALLARNPYNMDFASRIAFLDVDDNNRTLTGDRTEFLGRNGTQANPAAMSRARLSGRVGAGLDPAAAMQVQFDLADGQEKEIVFRLGIGQNVEDVRNLINRFRGSAARRDAYENLCQYWKHTLGTVHVQTPDQSINMLVNGWLLYQTIACRLWARSGYYQSGGAFGFRDQLQDTMSLVHAEPLLLRKQLLLCASRQFTEGDVQHWWHPPSGRGVRTHCSDDYLWLPLATARYVMSTGDTGVLDEKSNFLSGRPVNPQDDSYYDLPGRSEEEGTLYEHCKRAILFGLKFGEHGLPLMGGGDWNDGMNLVGAEGKGESIWLGFFLYEVLRRFSKLARRYGDELFSERCESEAAQLQRNIEADGWDGNWYRRAYFDDGTPLGSKNNDECRIDSISQSWSVLSKAARKARSKKALDSADRNLVRPDDALIQLLDPPFDKSHLNPGYIKGYVPGVRENGGQYTHAAIWLTMAFAAAGENKRAWELMDMINPVNHGSSPEKIAIYKAEPYVVAADVYGVAPHTGRAGWTWYTGSASWMYRLIVESLLGIHLEVDKLSVSPCWPSDWQQFTVHYRFRETVYHITVIQGFEPGVEQRLIIDGVEQKGKAISLIDDGREHMVELRTAGPSDKHLHKVPGQIDP